jgi:hypothetical protein
MDKLTVISGFLFFLADVFAIASLANPEWIVTDNQVANCKSRQIV